MDYRKFIAFVLILSTMTLGLFSFLPKGILYRWFEMPEIWSKFGQFEQGPGNTSGLISLPEFSGKYTIYNPEYDCYLGLQPIYTNGKESGVSMYCHPKVSTQFTIFGPIQNTIEICAKDRCLGDYAFNDEMMIQIFDEKSIIHRKVGEFLWMLHMQKIITNNRICKSLPGYYYPLCLGIVIPVSGTYPTNWGYSVNTCFNSRRIGIWTIKAV